MPHDVSLITTLAAAFGLALVFGFLATLIKLPPLVGYLVAGVLLGPATPGFVANVALSQELAEIGVVLLMFGVGLHFSREDLLSVRRIAVPGAIGRVILVTAVGLVVALAWGWSAGAGLVFGLALSVASTVVLLRVLEDRGLVESMTGKIAIGWLVVEDLAMVLVLVLLPPLAGVLGGTAPSGSTSILGALGGTVFRIGFFIAVMLVIARRALPWMLWRVAGTGSRELFTLAVIAVGVGVAYGAARFFGVSVALGAFFSGTVLRESTLSHRAAEETLPLRDAFSVLFFVSVGMLFDPSILIHEPFRVAVVVTIIVLAKTIVSLGIVLGFGYPVATALTVAVGLAQIGEFSFILATLGGTLGLLPPEATNLILAGAILSIALNPVLFRAVDPLRKWAAARSPRGWLLEQRDDPLAQLAADVSPERLTNHIVLVGFGRVGSRIGEALRERRIPFVVAEQAREVVEHLRTQGILAISGDASEAEVLVQAHVARARHLVIAIPDTARARTVIDLARRLNPRIHTVVRTHSDEEAELLRDSKVDRVFMGEHELANSMIQHLVELTPAEERKTF